MLPQPASFESLSRVDVDDTKDVCLPISVVCRYCISVPRSFLLLKTVNQSVAIFDFTICKSSGFESNFVTSHSSYQFFTKGLLAEVASILSS